MTNEYITVVQHASRSSTINRGHGHTLCILGILADDCPREKSTKKSEYSLVHTFPLHNTDNIYPSDGPKVKCYRCGTPAGLQVHAESFKFQGCNCKPIYFYLTNLAKNCTTTLFMDLVIG